MRLARLWILAAAAGTLGALVIFDARPGLNWTAWTALVIAGLLAYRRPDAATRRALALPLGFAIVLAGAATVTTTPLLLLSIVGITASLLALSVLLAREPARARVYGAFDILTAPVRGFAYTLDGALRTAVASASEAGAARLSPALRGAIFAAPVVVVFALLFATADPLFARGRDVVLDAIETWSFIPRVIFGVALGLFVLGAYAASLACPVTREDRAGSARRTGGGGSMEWRIVLGATAAISWLFVLFQLSYLFGAAPAVAGSGVTFAGYARQGFGQLAFAATTAALLIVAAEVRVAADEHTARRTLVIPALTLLAAVACILASAFHRVTLYENAYGFTTSRVYAQAYMLMTFAILAVLAWHVARTFDVNALARHIMAIALATLTVLAYWNADAWVARENVARYAQTGKLDVTYLTRGLSPDAYPTLAASLPGLREPERTQLAAALQHEYARRPYMQAPDRWYEWNARRERARGALLALGVR